MTKLSYLLQFAPRVTPRATPVERPSNIEAPDPELLIGQPARERRERKPRVPREDGPRKRDGSRPRMEETTPKGEIVGQIKSELIGENVVRIAAPTRRTVKMHPSENKVPLELQHAAAADAALTSSGTAEAGSLALPDEEAELLALTSDPNWPPRPRSHRDPVILPYLAAHPNKWDATDDIEEDASDFDRKCNTTSEEYSDPVSKLFASPRSLPTVPNSEFRFNYTGGLTGRHTIPPTHAAHALLDMRGRRFPLQPQVTELSGPSSPHDSGASSPATDAMKPEPTEVTAMDVDTGLMTPQVQEVQEIEVPGFREKELIHLSLPLDLPLTSLLNTPSKEEATPISNGGEVDGHEINYADEIHQKQNALPKGKVGKLLVHASGKLTLKIGDIPFTITLGVPRQHYQAVVATVPDQVPPPNRDTEDAEELDELSTPSRMVFLGPVANTLVGTPYLEAMIGVMQDSEVSGTHISEETNRSNGNAKDLSRSGGLVAHTKLTRGRLLHEYYNHKPVAHSRAARSRSGSASSMAEMLHHDSRTFVDADRSAHDPAPRRTRSSSTTMQSVNATSESRTIGSSHPSVTQESHSSIASTGQSAPAPAATMTGEIDVKLEAEIEEHFDSTTARKSSSRGRRK